MLTRSRAQKCCKPDLATVILAAPALATYLSPQARAALSACNRQLRCFVHSTTQVMHLDDVTNISRITQSSWPQLALVTLPTGQTRNLPLLSSIHMPHAAILQLTLSDTGSSFKKRLLLTPGATAKPGPGISLLCRAAIQPSCISPVLAIIRYSM